MPDMSVPPPNQCYADRPDDLDGASDMTIGPPPPETAAQPTAAFGGTDGAEGGANAGSDELVRRFTDEGAGGAPGVPGALSESDRSCFDEDLKTLATCGKLAYEAVLTGSASGPGGLTVGGLLGGLGCVGSLLTVVDCHLSSDEKDSGH